LKNGAFKRLPVQRQAGDFNVRCSYRAADVRHSRLNRLMPRLKITVDIPSDSLFGDEVGSDAQDGDGGDCMRRVDQRQSELKRHSSASL
jgi:hypothetical protein